MPFLNDEQKALAQEIAAMLTARGESVAVAESTTGGLVSAALLWVPGASRYYAGGGVLYTLHSRVALAGAPADLFQDYQGTTPEMLEAVAASLQAKLGATWCVAESGLAGPTPGRSGAPAGRCTLGAVGPIRRFEVIDTGIADREANMVEFTSRALRLFRDMLREAGR